MQNLEITVVGMGVLAPNQTYEYEEPEWTWPEDRWLIGWDPWIGYGKGTIQEGHLILFHEGVQVLMRGPHKEVGLAMYDECRLECFPAGLGRFVKAGEKLSLQFLVSDSSGGTAACAGQANARVFSVKA